MPNSNYQSVNNKNADKQLNGWNKVISKLPKKITFDSSVKDLKKLEEKFEDKVNKIHKVVNEIKSFVIKTQGSKEGILIQDNINTSVENIHTNTISLIQNFHNKVTEIHATSALASDIKKGKFKKNNYDRKFKEIQTILLKSGLLISFIESTWSNVCENINRYQSIGN